MKKIQEKLRKKNIYLWKDEPGPMSSKLDLHSGCLKRDFGVMITKGFLKGTAICLLKMWK